MPSNRRRAAADAPMMSNDISNRSQPQYVEKGRYPSATNPATHETLPTYNHNGHRVTKNVHPDGESGRRGFHPLHFFKILWKSSSRASMLCNLLWPFVPAAFALHFYGQHKEHFYVWIFAISYIAMVPSANLLGFAGQELARKLPKVAGILIETTLSSVVEIVLFVVLIVKHNSKRNFIPVIQAAILGSILTNLLLCLGLCFFVGGLTYKEQKFHAVVSEVGSGILLVAGFGLVSINQYKVVILTRPMLISTDHTKRILCLTCRPHRPDQLHHCDA